jgi:signal transduction histidine kinase
MKAASHRPLNREPGPSASQEPLALALDAGRIGTWELSLVDPNPLLLSPEFRKMLDLSETEFDQSIQAFLKRVHPLDRFGVIRKVTRSIRLRLDPELEFRFEVPGRGSGWILCRGRLYCDEDGQPSRLVGVGIDITNNKVAQLEIVRLNSQLEKRITERTLQLEATTRELETFCYSVSHDLRAPLRSIRGFNEVLLERYASSLDARGQEFLRRACQASCSMDELIGGLLKLSRVGRAELLPRTVELSALATGVAAELSAADPSRNASFLIAPGLKATGDERLLKVLLENLLRNAWKFTSKTPHAHIEVGFAPRPEPAFFVRDNGAGFDASYAGRLFGLFQRLHSNTDFPGTGVGLATVQRIINRHGGRVWATGAVDQGATFFFSLPNHATA